MKKVLVCCGSSMITSSIAINKLKEIFEKEGIDVKFGQCKFAEVPSEVKSFQPDVVVPTGPLDDKDAGGVPVVRGTCFITGVGVDKVVDEILDILKK
ncbi:PTS sugar transporter subunit IIB [Clostridium sp. cel8]|jgi:galactitol PTS system EIIB component|uniref:PTS sugar transporter subunit IIB n=1 Tax=unclassified Clostridium TaxID=2614128 RepID=UPI0015F3B6FC|nr:PTS sugar transporter subunit IIB [Clostridium sp. cel8]MBA5850691.1 PTS sugar transporter subunit IIB [Clostridium sp. cel8]